MNQSDHPPLLIHQVTMNIIFVVDVVVCGKLQP